MMLLRKKWKRKFTWPNVRHTDRAIKDIFVPYIDCFLSLKCSENVPKSLHKNKQQTNRMKKKLFSHSFGRKIMCINWEKIRSSHTYLVSNSSVPVLYTPVVWGSSYNVCVYRVECVYMRAPSVRWAFTTFFRTQISNVTRNRCSCTIAEILISYPKHGTHTQTQMRACFWIFVLIDVMLWFLSGPLSYQRIEINYIIFIHPNSQRNSITTQAIHFPSQTTHTNYSVTLHMCDFLTFNHMLNSYT